MTCTLSLSRHQTSSKLGRARTLMSTPLTPSVRCARGEMARRVTGPGSSWQVWETGEGEGTGVGDGLGWGATVVVVVTGGGRVGLSLPPHPAAPSIAATTSITPR